MAGKKQKGDPVSPAPAPEPQPEPTPKTKPWSGDREAVFAEICKEIANGIPLREICRRPGMPSYGAVYDWIEADPDEKKAGSKASRFARARELGFDQIAEECLEIADNAENDWMESRGNDGAVFYKLNGENIQRSKLRAEIRLKLLAKWSPKYSEKVAVEHSGGIETAAPVSAAAAAAAAARAEERGEV